MSVMARATVVGVDEAVAPPDGEVRDGVALFLEALAGVEHGLVLDDGGDDVEAIILVELGDAFDREVVALRRAGGEDDLLGDVLVGLEVGRARDSLIESGLDASRHVRGRRPPPRVQPKTWLRLAALP